MQDCKILLQYCETVKFYYAILRYNTILLYNSKGQYNFTIQYRGTMQFYYTILRDNTILLYNTEGQYNFSAQYWRAIQFYCTMVRNNEILLYNTEGQYNINIQFWVTVNFLYNNRNSMIFQYNFTIPNFALSILLDDTAENCLSITVTNDVSAQISDI